jgi:biotin operon repressor
MSVAGYRITLLETKERLDKMLTLNYTVEKEGNLITVADRLMLSEIQINNLMDSLVAHGYDVLSMEVK